MSAPFIDDTGFHSLGFNGWISRLTAQYQSVYGSDIDVSSNSPDGQVLTILAGDFADLEQLAMDVYNGLAPAGAVGSALSRIVQLNGISRKPAQFSTAPVTLTGANGTVVPAGSLVASNSDPTKPAWALTTTVTIGMTGEGFGTAQCTVAGPIAATQSPPELTVIQSPIAGWVSVANSLAATPGMIVEADPALRVRRSSSVAPPSQSLVESLRVALLGVPGVTDAVVYENPTATTDSKSLPPHSIKAIVAGGTAADIANALWNNASMGVTKTGAQSFTITDTQGNPQTQNWDNPTDLDVYITIKLAGTPANLAPSNLTYLQSVFAAAIVAYYSATGALPAGVGQNIAWFDIATPVNALGLTGQQGLPSVTNVFLGSSPGPTLQADLVVAYDEFPVFDVSRIQVVGP